MKFVCAADPWNVSQLVMMIKRDSVTFKVSPIGTCPSIFDDLNKHFYFAELREVSVTCFGQASSSVVLSEWFMCHYCLAKSAPLLHQKWVLSALTEFGLSLQSVKGYHRKSFSDSGDWMSFRYFSFQFEDPVQPPGNQIQSYGCKREISREIEWRHYVKNGKRTDLKIISCKQTNSLTCPANKSE